MPEPVRAPARSVAPRRRPTRRCRRWGFGEQLRVREPRRQRRRPADGGARRRDPPATARDRCGRCSASAATRWRRGPTSSRPTRRMQALDLQRHPRHQDVGHRQAVRLRHRARSSRSRSTGTTHAERDASGATAWRRPATPSPTPSSRRPLVDPPEGSEVIEEWEFFYGLAQRLGLQLKVGRRRGLAWTTSRPPTTCTTLMTRKAPHPARRGEAASPRQDLRTTRPSWCWPRRTGLDRTLQRGPRADDGRARRGRPASRSSTTPATATTRCSATAWCHAGCSTSTTPPAATSPTWCASTATTRRS